MSLASFFRNNKKINKGDDLDPTIIEDTYNSIKTLEIKCLNYRDLVFEDTIDIRLYIPITESPLIY